MINKELYNTPMELDQFNQFLAKLPSYRRKQIYRLIFVDLITDWQKAYVLPKFLRNELDTMLSLVPSGQFLHSSNDKTIKAVITLSDELKIETVLMRYKSRNSVCVSSQVGCALGCRFCATGRMGFRRNLTSWEIVQQVLMFARFLSNDKSTTRGRVTNLVFMGMGEPFLNYDQVIGAIRCLHDPMGFNMGSRHFSISTSGIPDGIRKLADELPEVNLAFSLHAVDNDLRSRLMPINKKFSLSEVLEAIDYYLKKTNRKVMLEYILIGNVNDQPEHALSLTNLIMERRHLFHVNLIRYNPTGMFQAPTDLSVSRFISLLKDKGVSVTERTRFGRDIQASCGQLAIK